MATQSEMAGGLKCCGHGRFMLDIAQKEESLKQPVLRYHIKIRFWFQEYVADTGNGKPSHYDPDRIYYTKNSRFSTTYLVLLTQPFTY